MLIVLKIKKEQLLQTIKAEGEFSDFNLKQFDRPDYHLINKTYIKSIKVKILDQDKQLINFEESPTLNLHIKKTENFKVFHDKNLKKLEPNQSLDDKQD